MGLSLIDVLNVINSFWFHFVWFLFQNVVSRVLIHFRELIKLYLTDSSFLIEGAFLPASICWVSRSTLTFESQMNGIGSGNKAVTMSCQKTDEYWVGWFHFFVFTLTWGDDLTNIFQMG